MRIYKDGILENKGLSGMSADISNYSGVITVQSLSTIDSSSGNNDRPAAQLASFIIGDQVSKFQSLLSSVNITPVCAHIDRHSKQTTIVQEDLHRNQQFILRPTG